MGVAFEDFDFVTNLPNLFRRSLFIAAYSVLETHLNSLATDKQEYKGIALALNDVRGQGIERAQLYLKKVVGEPFPDKSIEWQVLKRLGDVRNILVHRYGRVDESGSRDKDLVAWMKASGHVEIFPLVGIIYLAPTFTEFVVSNIEAFFRHLGYSLE
jgi:hypothetical protein